MPYRTTFPVLLVGLCMAYASAGYAQPVEESDPAPETDAAAEAAAEDPSPEAGPTEEIVVTGSRIRRNEFSSASPITVITSETSALAGLLSSADILQTSTVAAGQQIDNSFSGFVTDGGPGARSVSLRGLGAQRTLVLVNGKRWGPSGVRGTTNSVDLTAVPSSVVGRYEILKDGASSIYGADAIAGVVNVITRERIEGFQLNLQGAAPRRGSPEDVGVDATWGTVGDTWSFNISANYSNTREMTPQRPGLVAMRHAPAPYGPGRRRRDRQHPSRDRRAPVLRFPARFRRLAVRLGRATSRASGHRIRTIRTSIPASPASASPTSRGFRCTERTPGTAIPSSTTKAPSTATSVARGSTSSCPTSSSTR